MKWYTDFKEQREALGWTPECKCHFRMFLNGQVVMGKEPGCPVHDKPEPKRTFWQKIKTYLKPKAGSDQ